MNVMYVRNLHDRVIHKEKAKASLKVIYAESKWINLIKDKNDLISVCEDCFSDPV